MHKSLIILVAVLGLVPLPALAGLDITAYSNLVKVVNPELDGNGEPKNPRQLRLSPVDFPERFKGLEAEAVYQFDESYDFRAGSYSGYNWWRNELAKLAGCSLVTAAAVPSGKPEKRYDAAASDTGLDLA